MLKIDLKGKRAFIAGVADDQGFGWAIAKALAEAGCEILVGTWPPVLKIFQTLISSGRIDESRKLSDGRMMEFAKIYALDAAYDAMSEVPADIRDNKRYQNICDYTVSDVAKQVEKDFGHVDIVIHSLANGPEVKNNLLDTSRNGYLAAVSSSSYSFVSLVRHFSPIMTAGGSFLTLTFDASNRVVPGYGGGMSAAKAALESDTRTLAFEAGRRYGHRVNAISAGPLGSRAARAIGFIDKMIRYSQANAPLAKELQADNVGNTAAFLCSPLAEAITGNVCYVDCGLNTMGLAIDSPCLADAVEQELATV